MSDKLSGTVFVEVQANSCREFLDRLQGVSGKDFHASRSQDLGLQMRYRSSEPYKGVAFLPPNALPLQVDVLQLVVAPMREGDGHLVVGALPQEHALLAARHLLGALGGARHLQGYEATKTGSDRLVATKLESAFAREAGRTEVVTETGTAGVARQFQCHAKCAVVHSKRAFNVGPRK
eukprot:750391-Hanusia_phi.AAC.5